MAAGACACDCGGGECGHCACAAAADDEKRASPHAWRHWARRCAAAPRRCAAALSARLGAHVPSALFAMLCIALLCRALSSAGDGASDFVERQRHHPPCTATLVIRRELLPGSPAPRVTVNGASPGPVLRCTLGRSVRYTVVNQLPDDATTMHWHGLGQRGTPWADGVVGVSQARGARARCPCWVPRSAAAALFSRRMVPFWRASARSPTLLPRTRSSMSSRPSAPAPSGAWSHRRPHGCC